MSPKPRILVGISMHPEARRRLEAAAEVTLAVGAPNLAETIGEYDGLIVYVPRFDPALFERAPALKVISCHSCPPDVLAAARARGVRVTLAAHLHDTVADMATALLLAAARNVPQADAAIRRGEWGGPEDLKVRYSGLDVFGKTLGIVGLGRIGALMARRLRGFDLTLLYYDLEPKPDLERELGAAYRPLGALLAASDIVAIHLPLNDATRGLIGEREFRLMRPHAILVNTARGAILDEAALARALRERWFAAAALDVLADEPIRPDSPLLALDNVVLAPHLGGSTFENDLTLVDDALRVLAGDPPRCPAW